MDLWHAIEESIYQATGDIFSLSKRDTVDGGCINEAYRISDDNKSYFVKVNSASQAAMFESEFKGLTEIIASQSVRAPHPIAVGQTQTESYLIMEYIEMAGKNSDDSLGQQLAAMHRCSKPQFGWVQNNTIGSTLQINAESDDWGLFWRDQRLRYQLQLAKQKRASTRLLDDGDKLLDLVPAFFSNYNPQPSLLHGDLWGGNYSSDTNGNPVIYDPACYYGDRETDIAMTELFGGFGKSFYEMYNQTWPLDEGYKVRRKLYNLYHVLNHFNLFGGGYMRQAEGMINSLLSEI